ncbi:unnamed protein product [Schistosoma mattheei]|uniref:Uncharacterized protein n=1 Tax=Schistosoma mattheei TaxID=31246 RepID=A0A183PWI9_9TREM|nr:unnamed protein product [Schistosoma mattheei]
MSYKWDLFEPISVVPFQFVVVRGKGDFAKFDLVFTLLVSFENAIKGL